MKAKMMESKLNRCSILFSVDQISTSHVTVLDGKTEVQITPIFPYSRPQYETQLAFFHWGRIDVYWKTDRVRDIWPAVAINNYRAHIASLPGEQLGSRPPGSAVSEREPVDFTVVITV